MTFCSELARRANEPMIGTAPRHDAQIVLSVPKSQWLAKLSDMDGAVKMLSDLVSISKGQLMLSLRHDPASEGTLWIFPHRIQLNNVHLQDYPRIVAEVMNGQIDYPHKSMTTEQVIMVCTHGKRDTACAKFGGDAVRALKALAPSNIDVWEVSHLGGHRFAGTAIVQPSNQVYGWISDENASDLLNAIQEKRILSHYYRGNAHYPPPLQVAEKWGWDQLAAKHQLGEIFLVNPQLNGNRAQVEVVMVSADNQTQHTILNLEGKPYTFITNTDSDATKERLIWEVV